MSSQWRCRLLGHAWAFAAEGEDVVWRCRRGCDAGGRRGYGDAAEARRRALVLARARPGPPLAFLRALAGTADRPPRRSGRG